MQRRSELLTEIKPTVKRWIAEAMGATTGGTTMSGTTAHELGGVLHTGTLTSAQAPQFLLVDGSRAVTGNLSVNDGKTIDGVDLSAHAIDPNAHHNRSHAITGASDHTATGELKWRIVGLTADSTLGYLTPVSTATGTTEAILKSSAAGKITLQTIQVAGVAYVDDTLDFGSDTMYEDASYLRVAGAKPVYFGQTVQSGTAWNINTSGDFTGRDVSARDITATDDFLAAGTGFRVIYHTHDYTHAHVVVNPGGGWTLDEQFGVDIDDNLLVRGYIVGKHALQVKDALLIAHYDGSETRGNTQGNPTGHMGQVATIAGSVLYRPGKFGKAVEIADGYTTLVSNTSFETDTTGWTDYSSGTGAGTRARSSANSYDGTYAYRIQKTGGATADRVGARADFAVTNGQTYVVSCRVLVTGITGGTSNIVTLHTDTNVSSANAYQDAITDDWVELRLTCTATATGTGRVYVWIGNCTSGTFYFDAVQAVELAYHVPYYDGTRTNGSVTYTNVPLKWSSFTLMAWVKPTDLASVVGRGLGVGEAYVDADNYVRFYMNTDDALYGVWRLGGTSTNINGTVAFTANEWHHAALTVDTIADTATLYIDGVLDTSQAISGGLQTGLATLYVGRLNTGNRLNGWVDDFAVINRALPASEIRAIYESDAPIFAETSSWHWRSGRNRVWADAEGLWMLSADSNAVLGAYAGDDLDPAATKAWGGFTLGEGDIAFGHNRSGSSGILWDRSAGKFGFYGNGNATVQVEIDTQGRVTAGAGAVIMSVDGVAAGGDVLLNSTGLSVGGETLSYEPKSSSDWLNPTSTRRIALGLSEEFGYQRDFDSLTGKQYGAVVRAGGANYSGTLSGGGAYNGHWSKLLLEATGQRSSTKYRASIGISAGDSGNSPLTTRVIEFDANDFLFTTPNTSTAAIGTYAKKMQVYVNGTAYYIPLYS